MNTLLESYLTQFFEISDNPLSLIFIIIITALIITLITAIHNTKTKNLLEKFYILEKGESPQRFLTWLISLMLIIKLIQVILIQPFIVDGGSMLPNFTDKDVLIIDKISYKFSKPKRGDVIVFKFLKEGSPMNGKYFIKRLMALPGDQIIIENGKTKIIESGTKNKILNIEEDFVKYKDYAHNAITILKEDEYFVMGDNRLGSYDSRAWGPIHYSQISGPALLEIFDNFSLHPQNHEL